MKDETKTKKQLLGELKKLKKQNSELGKRAASQHKQEQEKILLGDSLLKMIEDLPHSLYFIDAQDLTIKLARTEKPQSRVSKKTLCHNYIYNERRPCSGKNHPCILEEVKKTKKLVVTEHVHRNKEGRKRYYTVYGYPVLDNDGNVSGVIEYPLEITEKKHSEKSAEINLAKYKNTNDTDKEGNG